MMRDLQLARGDVCRDSTGLRVRIEEVDIYEYVHFSVLERSDSGEDEAESGQMSHVAFVHRFSKLPMTRHLVPPPQETARIAGCIKFGHLTPTK